MPGFEGVIYVAAGKDVKEGKAKVVWTVRQSRGNVKICIIYVLVPSKTIPMGGLGAEIPANSANEILLREHRDKERINVHMILDTYLHVCTEMGVPAEKKYIESDSVQKGIVELIRLHGIRKLVMGAAADRRYFRKMTDIESRKAIFVHDEAHTSCKIWFICNGHLIHTSTPSDQPNVECMLERQDTSQELATSLSHHLQLIRSVYHTGHSSLSNTQLEEELENVQDQLNKVMGELHSALEEKLRLESQFAETDESIKELEPKIIADNEMVQIFRQERELLQIELDNTLQKAEEVGRRKGDSSGTMYFSEFSITEIKEAVQDFDPALKIGEGGCGTVYRGFLRHTPVAIKIIKFFSMDSSQEFQQEVKVLSKVRHPNLITLIGACPEPCTLVYEYIPNGSLEDWLRSSERAKQLPWQARLRIATELCSVLAFLHSWKPSIVHGDVKPGNILLDAHFVSKLSDFGICRLLSSGERSSNNTTAVHLTNPKGTFGYMDPELLVEGNLTIKSDVYSFGIILLELLTKRPASGIANAVRRAISTGTLETILDPSAGGWPYMLAKELAHLALRCCEMSRRNRPDLRSDVWTVLQSISASCQ
ncbi:hypothetical protein EUGRSUZ_E00129 [Eucalyptus grandis]|uniref:Uncharacterized protein n=2 Tax=Eucalyptus grandis TaxID=71139 RepID=A0ACC3KQM6_EUCGR|nr:hypothetical protein EUGRSUZ_E00129 [Eucalyptus grandis]